MDALCLEKVSYHQKSDKNVDKNIVILGVFVADTAYRASRQPEMGETIIGNEFSLGPGGKGSNQAVAAALAGEMYILYHALEKTILPTWP